MATPLKKEALRDLLADLPILEEEKMMWLRIGFYVTAPMETAGYSSSSNGTLHDHTGTKTNLTNSVAVNLRREILEWWDNEKKVSNSKEIKALRRIEPIDELENRNGT